MIEYSTLIEYYFKKKVTTLDEYAEYYQKLKFLADAKVIDISFNSSNK